MIAYFGYGSLVNRATWRTAAHTGIACRLTGYQRRWDLAVDTPHGPVSGLTVADHEGSSIDGLLIVDQRESLPDLDQREFRYDRISVNVNAFEYDRSGDLPDTIYIYVAKPEHRRRSEVGHGPIRQSYLDAVLQGYASVFGEAGARRFVSETIGWDATVLDDRHDPLYPRAVSLSARERAHFDGLLDDHGVRRTGAISVDRR